MVDIKLLRENPEIFREGAKKKGFDIDIDEILMVDEKRRKLQFSIDNRKKELSEKSKQMGKLSPEEKGKLQEELKEFSRKIKEDERALRELEQKLNTLLLQVPNPPMDNVPEGKDESENVEIKRVGEPPDFDFKPRDHVELGLMHDLFDIERGSKVAGTRSYYLKGDGALLENALMRYAIDVLVDRGYTPFVTPVIVREECMVGSGYFPVGREEAYEIPRDGLFLIGTSEVTLVSYHMGEILSEEELPKKYAGYTTCFRREAGSYGKDVRGLYRVHQFQKVEQVIICRADEDEMMRYHSELLENAEYIVGSLGLYYRVVEVCTGEMGLGQVKKHDIECYMPGRGGWGETHSCSSFRDFQSRRSRIRYKSSGGKNLFPYTLNNTAAASPRLLIAIIEQFQQRDGSIIIPEPLRPYMNNREKIG
ncbi:MAG: serine--tRNA ligase [Spirochaetes bacterium]|nr:MAG: serine--tRNA ligase [Spirochaetota bacterium]